MKDKIPDNFGGLPEEYSTYRDSGIIILPVPFDKTSTWIKGADKGPRAIIEASKNMELYDIETNSEVYKKGIFTEKEIIAHDSREMVKKTYRKVRSLLNDKKFVVVLGGEHSVSLGAIKAHSHFFKDFSVLHFDAHSDMRDSYEGSKYSHACIMARAKEITDNIVSVGIRSMDSSELKNINRQKIFYASEIFQGREIEENVSRPQSGRWINKVIKQLSKDVYISIDLDVFDPSIMPSTGTPEPGGLDWYQVFNLLEKVSRNKNIIGFDIVELCPSQDKTPDFLAAKLIYKLLSLIYAQPRSLFPCARSVRGNI